MLSSQHDFWREVYLKQPSCDGLCYGLMTMPSAVDSEYRMGNAGVEVYSSPCAIMTSTLLAASTEVPAYQRQHQPLPELGEYEAQFKAQIEHHAQLPALTAEWF
jgi:hypothetical protein